MLWWRHVFVCRSAVDMKRSLEAFQRSSEKLALEQRAISEVLDNVCEEWHFLLTLAFVCRSKFNTLIRIIFSPKAIKCRSYNSGSTKCIRSLPPPPHLLPPRTFLSDETRWPLLMAICSCAIIPRPHHQWRQQVREKRTASSRTSSCESLTMRKSWRHFLLRQTIDLCVSKQMCYVVVV